MNQLQKFQTKFTKSKPFIKIGIIALMVVLIFAMMISFTNISPFAVTSLSGKSQFTIGETQSYRLLLKTVDPEQFRTDTHYREQYGRWRLVDSNNNVISGGRLTKIDKGLYDSTLSIVVPDKESTLIAEIIEYQFSKTEDGSYVRDTGTIRESEEVAITLTSCTADTDCTGANACSTQTTTCADGFCKLEGKCAACTKDTDCVGVGEKCISSACVALPPPEPLQQLQDAVAQPVTHTGDTVDGVPVPKTAPTFMIWIFLALIAVNVVLYRIVKKKRGGLFKRR